MPTARKIAEGDASKVGPRKLEEQLSNEPRATSGLPACPRHLKGRARSAWNFWSDEIAVMQIDKRPDGPMLEGACVAYARAVQADLEVEKHGITVKDLYVDDESKEVIVLKVKKNPAVEVSVRSWLLVKAFCSEFGLSPASRTRIKVDNRKVDEEDLAKLLSQPRPTAGSPLVQ